MKNRLLAIAIILSAGATHADPLTGTWQTEPDDGAYAHVEIESCGVNLCGTIERTFKNGAEFNSPNKGKMLLIDLAPEGSGKYRGSVWRPSNDKIYIGKVALNGNKMRLSGCVAGGLLCSRQTWSRID